MANTAEEKTSLSEVPGEPASSLMQVLVPAVGWLIPGAGHLLLKRWIRGTLLLVSIVAMFLIGLAMEGHVYHPNGGDILDMLGFVGDVGAGALYILSQALGWGPGAIEHATADYGTKFLIVAGLLNFISVADAYHIAIGKKK
ncbi:MAG TPA: DUF6677 family protein [Terriglobales bacterium]|jgi:hypothetical protein|nr:DUF6677 family protein [Terriglobales bacterium]